MKQKKVPKKTKPLINTARALVEGNQGLLAFDEINPTCNKRLAEYSKMGLRSAKWRAVIAIGEGLPSRGCIEVTAPALARYAGLCRVKAA